MLDCWISRPREIQVHVPPWIPVEDGRRVAVDRERLVQLQAQARRAISAARKAEAAARTIEDHADEVDEVLSETTPEELFDGLPRLAMPNGPGATAPGTGESRL